MIKIIRRVDRIASVPDRWARQYSRKDYPGGDKAETRNKLLDMKQAGELDERLINDVIGNDSWTEFKCDECESENSTLVRFGDEPGYDAQWVDVCSACLRKASELLEKEQD